MCSYCTAATFTNNNRITVCLSVQRLSGRLSLILNLLQISSPHVTEACSQHKCAALPFSAACQVYTAVNMLTVSARQLVETYLLFLAVTNSATRSELRLPCEAHESDG